MTAEKIPVFSEHIELVRDLLLELRTEYRWAYGVSHAKSVGDEVKVSGGTSDPTMTVLLSKRSARRACEEANQAVLDAEKDVRDALARLSKALRLVEPPPRFEPLRYKADATRADMREAREAQLRRRLRGEGVPE